MANYSNLSEEELRKLFNVTKTPEQIAGQYANAGNSVMQLAAPQALQAPQDANVSLDFSGQPTLQAPQAQAPQGPFRTPEQVEARQAARDASQQPVPGLLKQLFVETPLQMGRSANQFASKVGQGFNQFAGDIMRASTPEAELGYKAKPMSEVLNVTIPERSPIYQAPANNVASPAETNESLVTTAQAVVPQASSIFQPQQTQPMPSQAIGQSPMQANQFSQEAAAQINPILAPQIDQTFDQAQVNIPPSLQNPFATQSPQPPQGNGLTTVGGTPLSEFLSGKALPEQGLMRAENPMYGDNSLSRGLSGDVATQAFQDASAAREARIEQNFGNGQAVSDRERRGTGEMSMEAAVRMAGGDRDEARQMIERQRQGRDPVTGEAIQGQEAGIVDPETAANIRKTEAETAKILSSITKNVDTSSWTAGQIQAMKTQAQELSKWEISELPTLKNNLATLRRVEKSLDDGQIKTGGLGDQIPGLSNWARPWLNPDAEVAQQEVNGVVMKTLKETFPGAISDGERKALISTVYNSQLSPDKNAELVRGYADRLNRAMNAKKKQVDYFRQNGSLEGYNGATPRDALLEGINIGSGSGGSPIEGDVDIQSESDQYYKG